MPDIDTNALGDSVKSQIEESQKSLATLFADQNFNLGGQNTEKFINLLIDQIGKNDIFNKKFKEAFSKIIDRYKDLGQQLDGMRSTFIPIELVRGIKKDIKKIRALADTNEKTEIMPNKKHYRESYENTFFRMLGLPESDNIEDFIYYDLQRKSYILASELSDVDKKLFDILEERQTYIRKIKAKNNVFDTELSQSLDERIKEVFSSESDQEFLDLIQSISADFKIGLSEQQGEDDPNARKYNAEEYEYEFVFSIPEDKSDEYRAKLTKIFSGKSNPEKYAYTEMYNFYVLEKASLQPDLSVISDDFEKFTYLLMPPVQDSRMSSCISEPDKIVRKPFGTVTFSRVNGEEPKISLLESVIRIRLDKLSGFDPLASGSSGINPFKNYSYIEVKDNYSFIENFFINRMYSTLNFLSEKLIEDIEDYIESTEITGTIVTETTNIDNVNDQDDPNSNKQPDSGSNPEAKGQTKQKSSAAKTEAGKEKENAKNNLRIIKNIDDTMRILLSSNSVLDIQTGTFRNSSLAKGQFMGIINSLVTAPGNLAREKMKEMDKEDMDDTNKPTGAQGMKAEISLNLGINRGIGLIDLATFTLAMFLVSEDYLIGMLTEEQFKNLKDTYPTANFFAGFKKPSVTESVLEYSKKIIGIYDFCKDIMNNDEV